MSGQRIATIPEMTDPMGKHWVQPEDIRDAEMDDSHVLLSSAQFGELMEYTHSLPSGVYPGKCWKCDCRQAYYLMWYGPENAENMCAVLSREIIEVAL